MKNLALLALLVTASLTACHAATAQERFQATGPATPVKMKPHEQGVVQVKFDLLPTSMRFNAPSHPCLVTENGIQYSNSKQPVNISLRKGVKQ